MSADLAVAPAPTDPGPPPPLPPRRTQRLTSWGLALRLARRDLLRHRGRSILMVLLVALPVAAVSGGLTLLDMNQRANDPNAAALRSLGDAPALISVTKWQGPIRQDAAGTRTRPAEGAPKRPVQADYTAAVRAVVGDIPLLPLARADALLIGDTTVVERVVEVFDGAADQAATRYDLAKGRLPSGPGEIALVAGSNSVSADSVGDRVELRVQQREPSGRRSWATRTAEVVGLVAGTVGPVDSALGAWSFREDASVVAASGWLTDDQAIPATRVVWGMDVRQEILVGTDVPWSQVLEWNRSGLATTSRAVLTDLPPGCEHSELCPPSRTDRAGARTTTIDITRDGAYATAIALIIGTLAVLQVALLAGPAFAVALRSRQRDLGLLAVNGADRRILSRQMLALGLTVGIVGGVVGFVIGYGAPWVVTMVGGTNAVQPAVPPPWWTFVPVMLLAVICALAAAWVPARIAGRTDVVAALSGRPHRPARPFRIPLVGILLLTASAGLVLFGTIRTNSLALAAAVLAGQLGLIALTPAIVAGLARNARHFPLGSRLAARDLDRNRLRTASAVAAVCAAMTAACTAVIVGPALSVTYVASASESPATTGGFVIDDLGPRDNAVAPAVASVFPETTFVTPKAVSPRYRTTIRFSDGGKHSCPVFSESSSCLPIRRSWSTASALVMTPGQLRQVTGIQDPAVARVLNNGGAIAFSEHAVAADGRITIVVKGRRQAPDRSVSVPGLTFPDAPAPAQVVVGPAFDGTALGARVVPAQITYAITPHRATETDLGRVQAAIARGEHPYQYWRVSLDEVPAQPTTGTEGLFVAGLAALMILVALFAALSVTALALADAKPDLATTAAVGAGPRFRRRFAASAAWLMATTGAALGLVAGVAVSLTIAAFGTSGWPALQLAWWWTTGSDSSGRGVAVPVGILLALVLGVPLACAAVAWLFTRSRVPMTRRLR